MDLRTASPHSAALFRQAFDDELASAVEAGLDPAEFRTGGKRITKAIPDPTGEDEAWWRREGPRMVQAWIDWRARSKWRVWTTPDGDPAIELGIETDIAGMPLKMIIDRVMVVPGREALCIVDLKTGARTPESDLQLGVYRLGLWRQYQVGADFGAYWMARKGELSDIVNLSRFAEPTLQSWFESLRLGIENQVFIPHLTSMCRACGHNRFCVAFGGADSHMDPDSPNYKEE
jgi:RecB family exonuclease